MLPLSWQSQWPRLRSSEPAAWECCSPSATLLTALSLPRCYLKLVKEHFLVLCRYMPGRQGAAQVILALREGWKGLTRFPLFPDRAAIVVSAGLLLPYSTPDFATSISKASSRV